MAACGMVQHAGKANKKSTALLDRVQRRGFSYGVKLLERTVVMTKVKSFFLNIVGFVLAFAAFFICTYVLSFILLFFSFNAPNAAPSRHKVSIFTYFFFSSLSLFVLVCVICGGKHGVSAFCKFSQRYFVNRELAGAVFCAGILRLRAHLKAKAGIGAAEWGRALARQFFCLEVAGE